MNKQEILTLQTMLHALGKADPLLPCPVPTGVWEEQDRAALRAFQHAQGLTETGEPDPQTRTALERSARKAEADCAPAAPLQILLQPGQVVTPGTKNHHLRLVQAMFQVIALFYPDLPRPEVTGILDEATSQALSWIQRRSGLDPSGALDRDSWQALSALFTLIAGDGTKT